MRKYTNLCHYMRRKSGIRSAGEYHRSGVNTAF